MSVRMDDSQLYEVSGLLFKRRGGFGKHMPNAWQQRFFFCTKDGLLYYFDTDSPENLRSLTESKEKDSNKSRGKIDLRLAHCEFSCEGTSDGSGAPTQFIILIVPANGEERWKLCASNKDDFQKWTKSLHSFSAQNKNVEIVRESEISLTNIDSAMIDSNIKVEKLTVKGGRLKLKTISSSFDFAELMLTLIIMNLCYYLGLNSSAVVGAIYVIIANYVVGKTLVQRNNRKNDTMHNAVISIPSVQSGLKNDNNLKVEAMIKLHPPAGSSLREVFTVPNSSPSHTWCKCDAKQFQVRIGPEYNRFKKKAPSAPALFEPFAVDVFCTNNRIDHASRYFTLPKEYVDVETNHPHIPPVFVVQIQIPAEPPASMFTTVEDGPGWAILMYFKITENTLEQLKDISTASAAVKLFAEYCEKCQEEQAWRARFKVIASCSNLDEMGLPQLITSYNAKPVLIRRTGSIFKGKGYIEKNIHVHKFANMAKSSIHLLSSRCALMYMQIGFVIEGRGDDELPETLFACVAINKPEEEKAETATSLFSGGEE